MYIKIKSTQQNSWYRRFIGNSFEVYDEPTLQGLFLIKKDKNVHFVNEGDFEIVDEEEYQKTKIPDIFTGGAGVLICIDNYLLLGERSDGQGWCMPGGKMEPGETAAEAAEREMMEEFGIIIHGGEDFYEMGHILCFAKIHGDIRPVRSTIYRYLPFCDREKLQFQPDNYEILKIKWFTIDEVMRLDRVYGPTLIGINKFLPYLDIKEAKQ